MLARRAGARRVGWSSSMNHLKTEQVWRISVNNRGLSREISIFSGFLGIFTGSKGVGKRRF